MGVSPMAKFGGRTKLISPIMMGDTVRVVNPFTGVATVGVFGGVISGRCVSVLEFTGDK
jgi:hypothetical protein